MARQRTKGGGSSMYRKPGIDLSKMTGLTTSRPERGISWAVNAPCRYTRAHIAEFLVHLCSSPYSSRFIPPATPARERPGHHLRDTLAFHSRASALLSKVTPGLPLTNCQLVYTNYTRGKKHYESLRVNHIFSKEHFPDHVFGKMGNSHSKGWVEMTRARL